MRCWPGSSGRSRSRPRPRRRPGRGTAPAAPQEPAGGGALLVVGRAGRWRAGRRGDPVVRLRAGLAARADRPGPGPGPATKSELSRLSDCRGIVDGVRRVQLVTIDGASNTSSMLSDLRPPLLEVDRASPGAAGGLLDDDLASPCPRRGDIRPARAEVELARGGEHRVADRLGVEPAEREAPEAGGCRDRRGAASGRGALDCR